MTGMMKETKLILALFLIVSSSVVLAQPEISPERKQAIDSLALEKVKDLGKYIM